MKMSNIEKTMIGAIVLGVTLIIFAIYTFFNIIEKEGGLSNAVINAGKEIKHIAEEIQKN